MPEYEPSLEQKVTGDSRESTFRALEAANERLHHQIGLMEDRLSPVLRPIEPLVEAKADIPPGSPLDYQVATVNEGADRVAGLLRRLVL